VTPAATRPAGNRPEHHPRQPGLPAARGLDPGNAGLPSTWRRLPAITTRHCSTLAPSLPHGSLERSRERRPGELPTMERRQHEPRRRQPWHTSATDACRQADPTTKPRQPRSAAGALPRLRPGITCRRSPPDTGAVVASWLASPIERTKTRRTADDGAPPARATPAATLAHVCNRCLPASRHHDQATATPIGSRWAASPSPWHHLPAIATRHWRRRRFVAGVTDREDEDPAELPVIESRQHGPRRRQPGARLQADTLPSHGNPDRQPVCRLAVALAPLAGDRHQALLDTGAVVASWPVSPIEGTKARRTADGGAAPVTPATTRPAGNRPEHHPRQPEAPTRPQHPRPAAGALPRFRLGATGQQSAQSPASTAGPSETSPARVRSAADSR
jgi:hypothetical protein